MYQIVINNYFPLIKFRRLQAPHFTLIPLDNYKTTKPVRLAADGFSLFYSCFASNRKAFYFIVLFSRKQIRICPPLLKKDFPDPHLYFYFGSSRIIPVTSQS